MAEIVQQPYNLFAQQPVGNTTGTTARTQPVVQQQRQPEITNMDELARAMGYTSPKQEERMRKASVANQRIMAVADALRHIGNIANTVNYAPAQQFNNPVEEEQARYERGKALRDKANQTYLSYQQAKAVQDAKARQWENEMNYKNNMLEHYQDQDRRLWFTANANANNQQALRSLQKQKYELDKAYKEGRIGIDKYNAESRRISANAAALRAGNSGVRSGGKGMDEYTTTTETTYNYDEMGKKTGSTTTKKRTVNGRQQPTQTTTKKQLPGQESSGKKKLPGT